jgi:hypothetical protein
MKQWQFIVSLSLGTLSLVAALLIIMIGSSNRGLQQKLMAQQQQINLGSSTQQVGVNILRDMGSVAVQNEAMRAVLKKNGFDLQINKDKEKEAGAAN